MLAKIKVSDVVMQSVICTLLFVFDLFLCIWYMKEFEISFVLLIIDTWSVLLFLLCIGWMTTQCLWINIIIYSLFAESWIGEARACKAEKEWILESVFL